MSCPQASIRPGFISLMSSGFDGDVGSGVWWVIQRTKQPDEASNPSLHELIQALATDELRADVNPRHNAWRYDGHMVRRADDFGNDSSIDVVNPDDDTSVEALAAWIADLERDGDWVELPTTAAALIAEDRTARGL